MIYVYYVWWHKNNVNFRLSLSVCLLAGIIFISGTYSLNSTKAAYYGFSILVCHFILQNPPSKRSLSVSLSILFGVEIIWGLTEYLGGVMRIRALAPNASALGLYALSTPLNPLAGFLVGLSLSRTALIGIVLFALLRNKLTVYTIAVMIIAVHVFTAIMVGPARITPENWLATANRREAAIEGNSTEPQPRPVAIHARELRLFGYGKNSYFFSTGQSQPHNIYVLSVWELGILAIPFWGLIVWLWWKSRNWYLLVIAPMSLLVDEWYTDVSGPFVLLVYHFSTRGLPAPIDNWRGFAKMRSIARMG